MEWLMLCRRRIWYPALVLSACGTLTGFADTIYAKSDATGANDGTSWEDAFVHLQDALGAVAAGDEIWVATGEYRPDQGASHTPGDRESSFQIPHGVALFGGFDGTEDTLDERAGLFELTILSGDLNGDDEPGFVHVDDNSYTVIRAGQGETGEIVIDGFQVSGGNAPADGGGLSINAECTVRNCSFTASRAQRGGAVAIQAWSRVDVSFHESRFEGNQADGDGGALWAYKPGALTLVDCEFVGNVATNEGGALYCADPYPLTVQHCTFRDNTADVGGSILANNARLEACNFEQNTARLGAGVYGAQMSLTDCGFERNTAQQGGGVFHYHGALTLEHCTFRDNLASADSPDAVALGGAMVLAGDPTTLRDCVFAANSADAPGIADSGAIHVWSNEVLATRCTFEDNTAGSYGGALSFATRTQFHFFFNCTFRRNIAASGGALFTIESNPRLVQSVFAGNVARDDGGAVCDLQNGRPFFINCVFHANAAGGRAGGIFNDETGRPKVWNTILWQNQDQDGDTGADSQIFGGIARIRFSCIQGWTGDLGGIATFGDDPLLVDPFGPDGVAGTDDDDFRLRAGSPCIDRGCNWLVTADHGDLDDDGIRYDEYLPLDLEGEPRFFDDPNSPDESCGAALIDLGPFEFGDCGPQPCLGDTDGDRDVDVDDLICLLACYGTTHTDPGYASVCDFDGKGSVDLSDLGELLGRYNTQCD